MSQEGLAAACGLHWTFVGQVERGRRNLSLLNILKVAAGLRVDAGELVRGLSVSGLDVAAQNRPTGVGQEDSPASSAEQ